MLTLITGTPGAGKSLYSVWEMARKVPGSTIEVNREAVPRKLHSNIRDLLVEHEVIGPDELNTWHQWAKPGDVILFDEVQECWRPRASGSKVPDAIAALETHRHKGVDIILVTQHPQLVDANIRRLVNQHLHLRRVTRRMAMVYEWDHCSNISSLKSAIQSKLWHHPSAAYALYKSAQAHTKPTQRLPRVALLLPPLLAAGIFMGTKVYGNMQNTFSGKPIEATATAASKALVPAAAAPVASVSKPIAPGPMAPVVQAGFAPSRPSGCMVSKGRSCECFDTSGEPMPVDVGMCESLTARPVYDLGLDTPTLAEFVAVGDFQTLEWMADQRASRQPDRRELSLRQVR